MGRQKWADVALQALLCLATFFHVKKLEDEKKLEDSNLT
jgi:hypothetical protein